jgi:hypothetical protein
MSRGVAYFNTEVKKGNKRLNDYFAFMQPESEAAPRVVKLRIINAAYKTFHT